MIEFPNAGGPRYPTYFTGGDGGYRSLHLGRDEAEWLYRIVVARNVATDILPSHPLEKALKYLSEPHEGDNR